MNPIKDIVEKMKAVREAFQARNWIEAAKLAAELTAMVAAYWQASFGTLTTGPASDLEWSELESECVALERVVNGDQPTIGTLAGPGTAISPEQVIQIIQAVLQVLDFIRKRRQGRQ